MNFSAVRAVDKGADILISLGEPAWRRQDDHLAVFHPQACTLGDTFLLHPLAAVLQESARLFSEHERL